MKYSRCSRCGRSAGKHFVRRGKGGGRIVCKKCSQEKQPSEESKNRGQDLRKSG